MATLTELEGREVVARYEPGLPPDELEERCIYVTQQFQRDAAVEIPKLTAAWTSDIAPLEQLAAYLDDFCSGAELEFDTAFHAVMPHENSVWELKTADLRIFGWFYRLDCFIAHRVLSADHVKQYKLYTPLCLEAAEYRDNFDLDDPKFIAGTDPYAVVSNYHCR